MLDNGEVALHAFPVIMNDEKIRLILSIKLLKKAYVKFSCFF